MSLELREIDDRPDDTLIPLVERWFAHDRDSVLGLLRKIPNPHLIVTGDRVEGFLNWKLTGSTVYLPLYLNAGFDPDRLTLLAEECGRMLSDIDHAYQTVFPRKHAMGFLDALAGHPRFETGILYYRREPTEAHKDPDDDTLAWVEGVSEIDSTKQLYRDSFAYEGDYVGPSWDSILEDVYQDPRGRWMLHCLLDGDLVGNLIGQEQESGVCLLAICSDPRHRGIGIGEGLMRRFLKRCAGRETNLGVFDHNSPAIRLYERHGFQRQGYSQVVLRAKE